MIPNIHTVYINRILNFYGLFRVFITGAFCAYSGYVLIFLDMFVMCFNPPSFVTTKIKEVLELLKKLTLWKFL